MNSLTSGHIYVGNSSGIAADVALSGDVALASNGHSNVVSISGTTVSGTTGSGNVVFDTLASLHGNTSIVGGTLDLSDSASGKIKFPSTASTSSDAHTLDAYEEGTWTPSLNRVSSYSLQLGYYTRNGNIVTTTFSMISSGAATSGNVTFGGWPFAAQNNGTNGSLHAFFSAWTGITLTAGYTQLSMAAVTISNFLRQSGSGVAYSTVNGSAVANPMEIHGFATYTIPT